MGRPQISRPGVPDTAPISVGPARSVRATAGAAAVAVLLGAAGMTVALVAAPGPWTRGYVSEAGTAGMALASAYRAGLLGVALGVLLLAVAIRPFCRPAGLLLVGAGVCAATSGVVPCTTGCPLPPYEPTTVTDVAHTVASIVGMAALFLAMVAVTVTRAVPGPVRGIAAVSAVVMFPLAATEALGMLLVGRGPLTSTVERLMLVVAIAWLAASALRLTSLRNSVILEG